MTDLIKEFEDVTLRKANVISYRLPKDMIHSAIALGDVHYKDNYKDDTELWKPIDLTIVNGRMDKAPYILEVKDNRTTITCKKTGRKSIVEMKSIGTVDVSKDTLLDQKSVAVDTDYKLVLHPDKVKFQRTLLSDKAPFDAKFKITGDLPIKYQAYDADGEPVELETSIKDVILTETVKEKSGLKYPIKVDPTLDLSVGASNRDISVGYVSDAWAVNLTATKLQMGYVSATNIKRGGGLYYAGAPPQGAQTDTSYITFTASDSLANTTVNLRITGNKQAVPAVWSDIANYQERRGTVVGGANDNYITTAQVDWDGVAAWTAETTYNSPEIKTVVQELVNQAGYRGTLGLFVDDHDARGDQENNHYRSAYTWDGDPSKAPVLHIEYTNLKGNFFMFF